MKVIYLAGGCFWGIQKYFDQFKGIKNTIVGYANGKTDNPTYEEVKTEKSGHSETVKIEYDEDIISLDKILSYYYQVIDPVSINKQGEDEGISYRTGIYYVDDEDLAIINQKAEEISKHYDQPIAVEIERLRQFYKAEEYHQKYLEKNAGGYCHIPVNFFHLEED